MKTNPRCGRAAFTLIELMAVITIIVILAGIVIGGMGFVSDRQAKEKAKVQIALLSKALEEYKLDNGTYPSTISGDGKDNSDELFNSFYYEGYDYIRQDSPANWVKTVGSNTSFPKATKTYLPELDPVNNKQGWTSGQPQEDTKIKDPWGNEYRYRSAVSDTGAANTETQNPDFDLWSVGKDGKTSPDSPSDKANRDDIKNF